MKDNIDMAESLFDTITTKNRMIYKKLDDIMDIVETKKIKLHVSSLNRISDDYINFTKHTTIEILQSIVNAIKNELGIEKVLPCNEMIYATSINDKVISFSFGDVYFSGFIINKKPFGNIYIYERLNLNKINLVEAFTIDEMKELEIRIINYMDDFLQFLEQVYKYALTKWGLDKL